MKKYLSLFLVTIMLLALLISCTIPQETDTNFSDSASTNDTNSDNTSGGNTNLPDEPTPPNNNQPDEPTEPTEKTHTATYQFTYDYGFHRENLVTLLVDGGKLRGDFESIVIPKDIVAGDIITIEYTGNVTIEETYPSHIGLNGEVISYSFSYANVIPVSIENLTGEMLLDYYAPNNYVILDRSGRYTTLDKYEGDTVYLVEEPFKKTDDLALYVACMLAYNPRDLENGISSNEEITVEQAIKIAEDDFYYNYAEDGDGFEYIMKMGNHNAEQWIILFNKEYFSGTHIPTGYRYAIDKRTGEIVNVEIAT